MMFFLLFYVFFDVESEFADYSLALIFWVVTSIELSYNVLDRHEMQVIY